MSLTLGALVLQAFANNGDQSALPQTDPSGGVNWNQGYTPDYEIQLGIGNPQARPVERPIMNELFNLLTGNQMGWQSLGFSQWYNSMPGGYSLNAMVMRYNGTDWFPYRSLQDNNVSDPLTTPLQWEYVPFGHEMLANVPMPSGGPSGSANEVISAATNFNSLTTGTWQIKTDTIAQGSANCPAPLGGTAAAGMIESLQWSNGAGTNYTVQRYLDRNGFIFYRGATGTSWTAWNSSNATSDYSVDASATANLVQGQQPLSSGVLTDNQHFWVKIANANTGATTFTPNAVVIPSALAVVGQAGVALQGGELVVGGHALFIYMAASNNFFLEFCSGATNFQVTTATKSQHAVGLSQMNGAIDQYAVDSGAANALAVVYSPAITAGTLRDNQKFNVKVAATNTGPSTLTVYAGQVAAAIQGAAGAALQGGELVAGSRAQFSWDATNSVFHLLWCSNGAEQVGNALQSQQAITLGQANAMIAGLPNSDNLMYRLGYLM